MKNFLKYLEAHIEGNPGIPGQKGIRAGEEDYLKNATRRRKEELGMNNNDGNTGNLMSLVYKSEELSKGHERELEALATKAIKDLYKGLIERYKIQFNIKLSNNSRDITRILGLNENSSEIYKRKIVTLVSQGEAINTKHLLHSPEVKEGINQIFGEEKGRELFQLWDKITKEASKLDQIYDPRARSQQIENSPGSNIAGAVDIKWLSIDDDINESIDDDDDLSFSLDDDDFDDEDVEKIKEKQEDIFSFLNTGDSKGLDEFLEENDIDPKGISRNFRPVVTAIGRDFPMLLHESVKGVYNVLSLGGIPEDRDVARIALKKGYARLEEPEEWKYGPTIAGDIRDFINENDLVDSYSNVREQVWKYMVDRKKLQTEEFLELIRGILSKTQEARIKVDSIIKIVVRSIKKFYDKKSANEKYKADMEKYKADMEKYEKDIAEYNRKMEEYNKNVKTEPEEVQAQVETPYSEMTPNELQKILNQALEDGDYSTAAEVSKFIK